MFKGGKMFTATQWNTAEEKAKFARHFQRFVEKGFPESMFNKAFYNRMSLMRCHIAHYNQVGFYNAQFSTSERRANFLHHWAMPPIYGDPEYTWCDVEKALASWLQVNRHYEEREREQHLQIIEHIERTELKRLKAKYETT